MKTMLMIACLFLNFVLIGCSPIFTTTKDVECSALIKPTTNNPTSCSPKITPFGGGIDDRSDECIHYNKCKNLKVSDEDKIHRKYYLPINRLVLKLERKEKNSPLDVTLTSKLVPYLELPLYLTHNHSVWYDDKVTVETDDNGLLKTISSNSDFKGKEIIEKMGELASVSVQLPLKIAAQTRGEEISNKSVKKNDCNKKFSFEVEIDLYTEKAEDINNKIIKIANDKFNLDKFNNCIEVDYYDNPSVDYNKKLLNDIPVDSILYSGYSKNSYNFKLNIKDILNVQTKLFEIILLDTTKIEKYTIERGLFVTRDFALTFTNGVLVKDQTIYPSEIYGAISVPVSIINSVSKAVLGGFGLSK